MARVRLTINHKGYDLLCSDGQESRLTQLAGIIDDQVSRLVLSSGNSSIDESRLILMVALHLADKLDRLSSDSADSTTVLSPSTVDQELVTALNDRLHRLAVKIEAL